MGVILITDAIQDSNMRKAGSGSRLRRLEQYGSKGRCVGFCAVHQPGGGMKHSTVAC